MIALPSTEDLARLAKAIPDGQTPLNEKLSHPLLDVFNEGIAARDNGTSSPYHGHSLEHCLHAAGWVQRDLRLALDATHAEIERLNNGLTDAACQISDLASRLGRAEGRLDASELVGVVEGWKARAEKAESERDEARAQVAAAYEAAAQWHDNRIEEFRKQIEENTEYCEREGLRHSEGNAYCRDSIVNSRIAARAIRDLASDDAQSALEAYGREKVREWMQRAAELVSHSAYGTAYWAILAEMEKLK